MEIPHWSAAVTVGMLISVGYTSRLGDLKLWNLACDMMIAKFLADIMPPIPWDVELARWFEERFPDLENLCQTQQKARSHARYS